MHIHFFSHPQNRTRQKCPPSDFFDFENFFENVVMSPKHPHQFFDILQQIAFSESPTGPGFHNFRHCEIFKKIIFVLGYIE